LEGWVWICLEDNWCRWNEWWWWVAECWHGWRNNYT